MQNIILNIIVDVRDFRHIEFWIFLGIEIHIKLPPSLVDNDGGLMLAAGKIYFIIRGFNIVFFWVKLETIK